MLRYLLIVTCLVMPGCALAEDRNLPQLGDRSSSLVSLEQERQLGQEFLRALRAQVPTVSDPLLQEYLELLIYKLALHSQLQDRRLDLVLIDSDVLNAFAAPGGIVGVHDGLFLYAETENEFSAILAHELAHLSQRHFARQAEAGRSASLPSIAGMLAGVILMAAGGGDAGVAAITAGQALSQDQLLRYSRSREAEADRVGIETLAEAGMDPAAMAYMFERLDRSKRFQGDQIPEFLLTHPVTRDRIADSYNQVRKYPQSRLTPNLDFQMMRARVIVNTTRNLTDAIRRMERGLSDPEQTRRVAHRYGLVLALTQANELAEARKHLDILKEAYPSKIAITIAEAELHMRGEEYEYSANLLSDALKIAPNNYPLTMAYANTLLKQGRAAEAEALLIPLTLKRPNDVNVWYLMAETYGLANNIVGVHEARAEYFVLVGNLDQAITQLGYAIPLVKGNFQLTARIRSRIEQIHEMRKKQRARS